MSGITLIKVASMVIMYSEVWFFGRLPIESESFNGQPRLQSFTSAFAGGLFLSVGIIHLLPEANENIQAAQGDQSSHFPIAFLICVLSFTAILYIEKIYYNPLRENQEGIELMPIEDALVHEVQQRQLIPYILQLAIGIHAIFEGLAIGIESSTWNALAISTAVIVHKWAEGLTLGLSCKKANLDVSKAMQLIKVQAAINPIGIAIGWLLKSQGQMITGIFQSISAGTFIYIACIEVIVEEFSQRKDQNGKLLLFLIAIGFISSLWFIENLSQEAI